MTVEYTPRRAGLDNLFRKLLGLDSNIKVAIVNGEGNLAIRDSKDNIVLVIGRPIELKSGNEDLKLPKAPEINEN